jgi:hypothetical protein
MAASSVRQLLDGGSLLPLSVFGVGIQSGDESPHTETLGTLGVGRFLRVFSFFPVEIIQRIAPHQSPLG